MATCKELTGLIENQEADNPIGDESEWPKIEELDEHFDVNLKYDSGPGKIFQDQKSMGALEHPRIKIANIPVGMKKEALREECESCGEVAEFCFISAKEDSRDNTSHAFVSFKHMKDASRAMRELSQLPVGSKRLFVVAAKTKEQKQVEDEQKREDNELLRECGYRSIIDNKYALVNNPGLKVCHLCGRDEKNLKKLTIKSCRGCDKIYYCSKECQASDWPMHQKVCKYRQDKIKAVNVSKPRFNAAIFKTLYMEERTPCTLWAISSPADFCLIPPDDCPEDYFVLKHLIQDFVDSKNIKSLIESPQVGELIIAHTQAEDAHERAVVTAVTTPETPSVDGLNPNVDLWFIDSGIRQENMALTEVFPIEEFWNWLKEIRRDGAYPNLNDQHFVELPARLLPCFLHAVDPNGSKSRQILARPNHDDPFSDSAHQWHPDAISFMKTLTSYQFDAIPKETLNESYLVYGVQLERNQVNIGNELFHRYHADFEEKEDVVDEMEEEDDNDDSEFQFERVLPSDVPQLPLENGVVLKTHFESLKNFTLINSVRGWAELQRMYHPIMMAIEGKTSYGEQRVKPMLGDLVIAPVPARSEEMFGRAAVLREQEDSVFLHFIDWGGTGQVPLSRVYAADPEITAFCCPATYCSLSPDELCLPGAEDIASIILNETKDEIKVKILQRESNPSKPVLVRLQDHKGDISYNLAERLKLLPRLKEMKLRRDLFTKRFPCEIMSFDSPENFYVCPPESEKLQMLSEDLGNFFCEVSDDPWLLPRKGQVVVGRDQGGAVLRFALMEDATRRDQFVKVRSVDYGHEEELPVHDLRRLPAQGQMVDLPVQSLHCKLKKVAPPSEDGWPNLVKEMVDDMNKRGDDRENGQGDSPGDSLGESTTISCELDSLVERTFSVTLFIDGENFADKLARLSLAKLLK